MNAQDRLFVFVEIAKVNTGNALMKSIDRKATDKGEETFGAVRLSADGNEPATHSACNTGADFDYKNALFGTSHAPWMQHYSKADGYTWQTACADMGLEVVPPEEI
jgi:hypothetical protein